MAKGGHGSGCKENERVYERAGQDGYEIVAGQTAQAAGNRVMDTVSWSVLDDPCDFAPNGNVLDVGSRILSPPRLVGLLPTALRTFTRSSTCRRTSCH